MNRVSDGDRSTLLSFVSSQGYAPQSDEVISILRVLFRYVGIGTRLALTSMSWLTTRSPSRQGKTRAVHTVILASPVTFVLQDTPPSVTDCAGDGVLTNGNHMVVSCVCVLLVSTFYHKTTFHNFSFYSLKQFGTRQALCHLSRQDTSRGVPAQGVGTRTGKSDVYQQPIAGLSPESSWVKEDPPGRGDNVFVLVSHSHHKTSRLCVETKMCWTLAEDFISEWAGLEGARLVNLARHV